MPQITLEVEGLSTVKNQLRRTADADKLAIGPAMQRFTKEMRAHLKSYGYPPKRPGQTYVRTGRLANSWSAQQLGEMKYALVNSAEYSSFVVGKNTQAWMHAGRWWIAADVLEEERPRLARYIQENLERQWATTL